MRSHLVLKFAPLFATVALIGFGCDSEKPAPAKPGATATPTPEATGKPTGAKKAPKKTGGGLGVGPSIEKDG